MPDVKLGKSEYRKLEVLIYGHMATENKSFSKLSQNIGVSENTLRKYVKNPDLITLGMLKKLRQNIHAPIDEWREAAIK